MIRKLKSSVACTVLNGSVEFNTILTVGSVGEQRLLSLFGGCAANERQA